MPMNQKPIDLPLERDEQPSSEKDMRLQWFEAASGGKFDEIITLLAKGANVYWEDDQKCTSLHLAAGHGHKDVVQLLLSRGAAINAKNRVSDTVLHLAASNGHKEVVQLLLAHGAGADEKDDHSRTALHKAVMNEYSEIKPQLLFTSKNVDDEESENGKDFLAEPSEIGDVGMATLMLDHGADIEAIDVNGQTPLIFATKFSHLDMVSLLINKGANLEAADNDSLTALHWSAKVGNIAVLELLLEAEANIEARAIHGDTALHFATDYNYLDIVTTLLNYGADIDAKNEEGSTPTQVATLKCHKEIEHQLNSAKAIMAKIEYDGVLVPSLATDDRQFEMNRALNRASQLGQVNMVSRLLDNGADVDAYNDDGLSPIFVAGQFPDVISVLVHCGACLEVRNQKNRNFTVLHYYASLGQIEALRILLNVGCNIHSTDDNEDTPLHYAARKGDCEVALLLLENGADIDARNCRGETALHVALQNEFFELPKLLIEYGIDIEAKTSISESTALHIAIETKNSELISLLAKGHAHVNARNALGQTALHLAILSELEEACYQLLEHNANVNAKDRNDCTPLHVAVESFNPALVTLLLNRGALAQSSNHFDDHLSHAISRFKYENGSRFEVRFIAVIESLVEAGADTTRIQVPGRLEKRLPLLTSILAKSPSQLTVKESKTLNTSSIIGDDYSKPTDLADVVLSEFDGNSRNGYKISHANKRNLNHTKHKYGYGWPLSKNLQLDKLIDYNEEIHLESSAQPDTGANLQLSGAVPLDERAIAIIRSLLDCYMVKLFISDHFLMLEVDSGSDKKPPKWASEFDKMKGIIREPGLLIVQIPESKTALPTAWHEYIHPYLCFIDSVYACRVSSIRVGQEAFSDILGCSEQTMAEDLHSMLIASLSILSIVGGNGLVENLVMSILGITSHPVQPLSPNDISTNFQVLNRRECSCMNDHDHRPLSPAAAAKAVGIDIWRERHKHVKVNRVWDLQRDQLVHDIDATRVIFVTHGWGLHDVTYQHVLKLNPSLGQTISKMSEKLYRIRMALLKHTRYVWIDTICIDKSNLSELDEAVRTMYKWYASCAAVVLDFGTPFTVWRRRCWSLQEGAAAGILCGISKEGKLATIQQLASEQHQDLCTLDLHLYYRPGNAAEILARMDARLSIRAEDKAYALVGIFDIHLTLAYGEGIKSRERLLHELAIQKGDLSCLSFQTTPTNRRNYLPAISQTIYSLATSTRSTSPIRISHLGICLWVNFFQGTDASPVLRKLKSWKHLSFVKGRSLGLDDLITEFERLEYQGSPFIGLAIVHEIKSIILVQIYGRDSQTGESNPIKLCHRLQCCQIEENEFERLFKETETTFEQIWLGNDPNNMTTNTTKFGLFHRRDRQRQKIFLN